MGGDSLATALTDLTPGGVCVTFGNGSRTLTSFHPGDFYHTPGARLQGLRLGNFMIAGTDCGPMLRRLVELVRQERLRPPIDAVVPWTSIGEAAERLSRQGVDGKIVVTID
ncbi:zinc-binding dehydrogenase [Nonomuraea diastatica]|uniref:zinc-binding dehydrogenase n=1 Tax=Nonomuraea diastatica TaxID=1848329 RepID=UPI001FE5E4F0|nr:zinc-binding dehydrogenase [Nonomuraea diastatica]